MAAATRAAQRVPLFDLEDLAAQRVIVPCDVEGSLLTQRLTDNSMPPPGAGAARPTDAEIAALATFIERPYARR